MRNKCSSRNDRREPETYGRVNRRVRRIGTLVRRYLLDLGDGGVVDHRDDRDGHVGPHHVSVRHPKEEHERHYVTRSHQSCNSKYLFVTSGHRTAAPRALAKRGTAE